jgi:dihydroneopterin aldolase
VDSNVLAGRFVASSHRADDQALDRIVIRDMELGFRIGVHAHEKLAPQRVRLNVEIEVRPGPVYRQDDIEQVLSYEYVLNGIKAMALGEHIQLVETLAERVAALCLADPRALRARVRVEKLEVEPSAAGVGVEIERRR